MKRLLMVTLLIALASNLCMAQQPAYEFPLSGSQLYRLRWGLQEGSADLVPFPPVLGQPVCAQKGSTLQLGIRWNSQHGRLLGWMPLQVVLSRAGTGEVIWQHPYSGSNWLAPDAVYPLRALPDHVEYATLWSEGLLLVWTGFWPLPVGVMPYSTVNTPSEVFVVLDAPKAPMSPAWVNVLRKSCVWARETTTPGRAAELLTMALWQNGRYDPEHRIPNTQFYTSNEGDSGENFHLRSFLEDAYFPRGQCNDFADFLLCLVTSVGAYEMKAQRTYSFNAVYWGLRDSDRGGWNFRTLQIDPAGDEGPSTKTFTYHQYATVGSQVWDGCFAFIQNYSTVLAIGWQRDTVYRSSLIDRFLEYQNHQLVRTIGAGEPGNPWNPTPSDGFMPAVTTEPKP